MQRVATLIVSLLFSLSLSAQDFSNLRVKTIVVSSDTTCFDTLAVADLHLLNPGNFDTTRFVLDAVNACLITQQRGTITIRYRALYYPIRKTYLHKERTLIRKDLNLGKENVYVPQTGIKEEEEDLGLNKSGVISRGITIGNNQNLVLNSIFNLQLSGRLNAEWNILGSITDDNTQLQPDGTTLQLQEFDKVYIKLYNQNSQVTVGDFELKPELSKSYFMRYYKRNRGVYATTKTRPDSTRSLFYGASAAAAKGRYARQVVPVTDGNQGPYRLKGNNGELYILINAGSERIYLDDKLLVRGYENDYVIDYNTGEVSFTAKRLILATSRVVAEFQYNDRNYSRSVVNGFAEWEQKNLNLRFHYFSEKDMKNQPVLLELSDAQKQLLASVGDSISKAFSSSAREVNVFTTEKILYRKVDTLGYMGVYVLATGATSDTVYYEITFNEVGNNKGSYRLIKSDVNGKVYEFVPPINGIPQGNAEPLLPLTAPQGLQNVSLGLDYRINKNQTLNIELAGSNADKNEFSRKDKSDDKGFASHIEWGQHFNLDKKQVPLELSTTAAFDYIHQNFKSVERFRDINFTRVWNRQIQQVADANTQAMEYNTRLNIQLKKTDAKTFNIGAQQYTREREQEGLLYNTSLNFKNKRTEVTASGEIMQNDLKLLQAKNNSMLWSAFLEQHVVGNFSSGFQARQESSTFIPTGFDTLQGQSYAYHYGLAFVKWENKNNRFRLDASRRNDAAPVGENFRASFSTNIVSASAAVVGKDHIFQFLTQYKTIEVKDALLTNLRNDQGITLQVQHGLQRFRNALVHNLQCNAGSGQEQKKIFTFIEVPAGRGSYTWRDYNGDGVKQLNEFEQAYNADETKFVRVLVPTLDFSKVNYVAINETFNLQPYKVWGKASGLKRFMSRFEEKFTYKNELRQYAGDLLFVSKFNPENTDTTLINSYSAIESNLIFNHTFNPFDLRYNYRTFSNSSLLTYGLDTRSRYEHELIGRYSINSTFFAQLYFQTGRKQLNSKYFVLRDYRFQYYGFEPRLNFEIQRALRMTLRGRYYTAKEELNKTTETINMEGGLDLHWFVSTKSFLDARASFVNIKFNGDMNSTVAYEMLQGLNNGNNLTVFLTYLHQVSSTMQINLNYNGRAAAGRPMIHTGGVEVRYLF